MLRVVIDTNIFASALITKYADSASVRVINALLERAFMLVASNESILEIRTSLLLDQIKTRHSFSIEEVDDFCDGLRNQSLLIEPARVAAPSMTRDISDTKFLDLSVASDADYLITYDRRHLLPIKKIGRTLIVTPHKFLLALRRDIG